VARPGEKADDPRVEEQPEAIESLINRDRASWNKYSHGLYDATALILKAADAKNVNGILDAGDLIDQACETCHLKYWYPKQYDLLQKERPSGSERGKK
jgi:cytochrome c556